MRSRAAAVVLLAPLLLLAACQSAGPHASTASTGDTMTARNQGYALLYSTLNDESQLDKILMIRNPDSQVAELIKAIAKFSTGAKGSLQALAKEDSTLGLDHQGLPVTEVKTRESISGATTKQIVFSGGKDFEFNILLTQHQALNYITHLAGTLHEQDADESRKGYMAQLVKESESLHERVIAQLKTPYVGQTQAKATKE